jgi:hypothetical protein
LAFAAPVTLTNVGGFEGTRYVDQPPNASFEPTEGVVLDFDVPVDPKELKAQLTITPAVPFDLRALELGKRIVVKMRKVPGTTYHIDVPPGLRALDGSASTAPIDVVVKTTDEAPPRPSRATPNEPYRYGILAHPYPFSLTGPNAAKIVDELAGAGVGFVRIDYCGDQIENRAEGSFDWTIPDRVGDLLAASGITELPIVEQYCSPKWANGGFPYPAIWSTPSAYAAFAGAVAAHVAARYPRITRIELFNEPNLRGWWKNEGDPGYAATDGSATAQYMRAAYAAVKSAAARLTVVGPALAGGGSLTDPRTFFDNLYSNGCRRGACWDVVSVHNYRWENPTFAQPDRAPDRFDIYKSIQAIAAKRGDAGTHVMLTEWGYSTIDSPDGVDPKTQALYLALGFNLMLADPTVDGIVYVNMYNPSMDFWGQTALVTPDFIPKPAYAVYRSFALARR